MTVIAGSADFLLRKPDLPDGKRRQYLEAIGETADRATTLTNHLLAFGRRQAIKPEVLDLNVRLDAIADMLSLTLGNAIQTELELQPAVGRVEVDVAQLETAVLNAAVNARDAMPEGGTLTLSTRSLRENGADFIELAIRDTGTGMPKEVINRAFEPFFTTKEIGKGTGLGLSQIHGFAAQAGGRAEIRSEEGRGTTIACCSRGPTRTSPRRPPAEPCRTCRRASASSWSRTIRRCAISPKDCLSTSVARSSRPKAGKRP
jgi:signal transduction histidine kinase